MLKLTDSELEIAFAAARPLEVHERDAFLKEAAERLASLPERGDGFVFRICRELQRDFWDPPDLLQGPPARKFATAK